MDTASNKSVEYLVVDTTAFIQNVSLHEVADNIVTCREVVDEITHKRQLRRLVVLPYDLTVKDVFSESIRVVTEFSKKTGDYPSLSATDIKVMALTYQLEKEKIGVEHLRTEPVLQKPLVNTKDSVEDINPDITGFYLPHYKGEECSNVTENNVSKPEDNKEINNVTKIFQDTNIGSNIEENSVSENDNIIESCEDLNDILQSLDCNEDNKPEASILVPVKGDCEDVLNNEDSCDDDTSDDDNAGWITPYNVSQAKKQVNSQLMEERRVVVACMTTDFAMQNVLKQMNLNVSALDGRLIKQLRTYILRCYTCFKTTSIMTKKFCPKCGNDTLKKVAVSVDEKGEMHIHINARKPLTGRGKKFSLPRVKGGKHPNNPVLVEDQPMPDNKPSRLARTKNNPLDDDYIAGFSPFIMRDVNSKSAQLGIRPGSEFKHWMRKNPNESRRRKK